MKDNVYVSIARLTWNRGHMFEELLLRSMVKKFCGSLFDLTRHPEPQPDTQPPDPGSACFDFGGKGSPVRKWSLNADPKIQDQVTVSLAVVVDCAWDQELLLKSSSSLKFYTFEVNSFKVFKNLKMNCEDQNNRKLNLPCTVFFDPFHVRLLQ